jgi:glycosyltransferase involved in cell wall biosynthesis
VIVVFDGTCLADGPITGVSRAFLNGLTAYAANSTAAIYLLLPDGIEGPLLPGITVVPTPRGAWRRQLLLPKLLRQLQADVLHSPVAAVPLRAPCPTIATVHDLPWRHADSGESTSYWRRFATRCALRFASVVLAPSTFTLEAARSIAGHGAKLLLLPNGTTAPQCVVDPALRLGPLLALGDDRHRKNRNAVRTACALARERSESLPEICFAGPPDNYLDEPMKEQLLRGCRMLVQASRFEGFGMPVLEGLAHGIPTVCSDLPPFREIAGDAAIYVDPRSPASIADGIVRAHEDAPLRTQLASEGPLRAARFTPNAVAAAWGQLHLALTR